MSSKDILKLIDQGFDDNEIRSQIMKKHGIYLGQNVIGTNGLVGQIIETNSLSSKSDTSLFPITG